MHFKLDTGHLEKTYILSSNGIMNMHCLYYLIQKCTFETELSREKICLI